MLFQVTHHHTHETCPGVHPELLQKVSVWWDAVKQNPDVKVLAGYVSPTDHAFHITIEANDAGALARAIGPLNALGTGHTSPVLNLDTAFPVAESGAFQLPGARS
jgi:hypothetical protein